MRIPSVRRPLALLALVASGCVLDEQPPTETIEQKAARVQSDLEDLGFEVARGGSTLFTVDDCAWLIDSLGNCMGNNPTAPYILPTLPAWPDEHVDPYHEGMFGPLPGDTSATWRLDEREAVVILGRMPPESRYFGLQTYAFSRVGEIDTTDPVYEIVTDELLRDILFMETPNPDRVMVFSSLGDSVNNQVIEDRSGEAWDAQRFFVISSDGVMERAVRDALLRADVPGPTHIFTEPVSTGTVRLGLDAAADDLMTLIRYAEPQDEAAGAAWREELPLVVLRVRDPDATRAPEPHAVPSYGEKLGVSEAPLADDLDGLVGAVKDLWGQEDAPVGEFRSLQLWVDLVGQHCIERPQNCLGDTQDADYQVSATAKIDDGQVLAIVGTLGTETGNATYVSLSVNWFDVLKGVANLSDRTLAGSAADFSGTVDDAGQLYLQYVARDCTGLKRCLEVSEASVPVGGTLKIIQRNYVAPGTSRGADPNLLVSPRMIVLDGGDRPAFRAPGALAPVRD